MPCEGYERGRSRRFGVPDGLEVVRQCALDVSEIGESNRPIEVRHREVPRRTGVADRKYPVKQANRLRRLPRDPQQEQSLLSVGHRLDAPTFQTLEQPGSTPCPVKQFESSWKVSGAREICLRESHP